MRTQEYGLFGMLALVACLISSLPARGAGMDATWRTDDARLNKPVTVTEKRIYLAELLQRLSAQTGLPLTTDTREPGSGVEVLAEFHEVPVGDVLDALQSLVSSRDVQWKWLRSGEAAAYRYQLFVPVTAKDKAARYRDYIQSAFENFVATMSDLAAMTPEERKNSKNKLAEALVQSDDQQIAILLGDEQMWDAIRLFSQAVPPEMRVRVLRGQQEAEIAVNTLPQATQELFHSFWTGLHAGVDQDGTFTPTPEPKTIKFYATTQLGPTPEVVPYLFLNEGNGTSLSVFGGQSLEAGVRAAIKKAWLLDEDAIRNPATQRTVAVPTQLDLPAGPGADGSADAPARVVIPHPLERRLAQLSEGGKLAVLGVLPFQQNSDPNSPADQTIGEFLGKVDGLYSGYTQPMHKWRGNVLLVSSPAWFIEDDGALPYALARTLRTDKDGLIPLTTLTKILSAVNEAQARHLAEEYPVMKEAFPMRPLFALYATDPVVLSPNGVHLDENKLAMLRSIPMFANSDVFAAGTPTAVRLTEQDTVVENRKEKLVRAEVNIGDKWVLLGGFTETATPSK